MLNIFYWYTIIWGLVLFLYELKLSRYNARLNDDLLFFLLFSILISALLGKCFKKILVYPKYTNLENISYKGTLLICLVGIVTFLYAGHVPFVSIIMGKRSYGDFEVLPFIQPIYINYIIYRVSKLYFFYLETRKRRFLLEILIILGVLMLMFFKGTIVFCLFSIINLYIAKKRINKKMSLMFFVRIFFVIFSIFYINGGLANLRTGYEWNDSSFISRLGGIKTEMLSSIIPGQFLWGYVYITSPLANLNLCVENNINTFNIKSIIVSTIPLFLSKRIFPDKMNVFDMDSFSLYHEALNACTGYVNSVVAGGIYGLYYLFVILIIQMILIIFIMVLLKIYNRPYYFSAMSIVTTFLFFYNTLTTAATSLIIYIIILSAISKKIKLINYYNRGNFG